MIATRGFLYTIAVIYLGVPVNPYMGICIKDVLCVDIIYLLSSIPYTVIFAEQSSVQILIVQPRC